MIRVWNSMNVRLRVVVVAVVVVVVLPVAWYLGSPLFINKAVDEAFPASAQSAAVQPADMTRESTAADKPASPIEKPGETVAGTTETTEKPAEGAMENSGGAPVENPAEAMSEAAAPIALSSGQFGEIDAIHKGEGMVTVYKLPDGKQVLRFENFSVTNGPDLYVYLSGHPAPRTSAQLHEGGAYEVARLKGNIGAQNYELAADVDLSLFKSVVIYCKRFSVVFSTAELMVGS